VSLIRDDDLEEEGADVDVLRDSNARELLSGERLLGDLSDEIVRRQEDAAGTEGSKGMLWRYCQGRMKGGWGDRPTHWRYEYRSSRVSF
jgi:hypothetical protein